MTVPNQFGTATSAIPLSQLDANFNTPITLGNTAIQLGDTVTTLNNMTLANVTISSGNVTITNVAITTANVSGTANISTLVVIGNETVGGNTSVTGNSTVAGSIVLSGGTANGVAYLNTSKQLTTGSVLVFDGTTLSNIGSGDRAKFGNGTRNIYIAGDTNGISLLDGAAQTGNGWYMNGSTNFVAGYVSSTETLRLTSTSLYTASGINVGIGTTNPATKLVVGNGNASEYIDLNINGGTSANYGPTLNFLKGGTSFGQISNYGRIQGGTSSDFFITSVGSNALIFGIGQADKARIDSSGNLLVGTADSSDTANAGFRAQPSGVATSTLTASGTGDSTMRVYSTGAGAYRFFVRMDGTIFATSIVITAISDERLKENVRDIDTGLNSIMSLKPRRFDWKDGKGQDKKNAAGFIAQEFEDVFPECVGTSKAGADGIEYKSINHETLIPTLVKAIQELKAEIDSLKSQLNGA